eukprot:SAG11_NODE_2693_length_3090_cov_1.761953_3_plen_98_part_00
MSAGGAREGSQRAEAAAAAATTAVAALLDFSSAALVGGGRLVFWLTGSAPPPSHPSFKPAPECAQPEQVLSGRLRRRLVTMVRLAREDAAGSGARIS